jgi:hypothetical protein
MSLCQGGLVGCIHYGPSKCRLDFVFYEQWPIGVGANLSSQRHQTKNQNIKPMLFSKSDGVVASLNPVHVNGVGGYYNTCTRRLRQ